MDDALKDRMKAFLENKKKKDDEIFAREQAENMRATQQENLKQRGLEAWGSVIKDLSSAAALVNSHVEPSGLKYTITEYDARDNLLRSVMIQPHGLGDAIHIHLTPIATLRVVLLGLPGEAKSYSVFDCDTSFFQKVLLEHMERSNDRRK
ncbi:MAG TPA: hypothetical protein VGO06_27990 [Bosea sp. (in: a-proteobacteria)]|uniref:hypothetical protein n=1 Tax=Bosea sp. (in: a-proteobacteria) TaxID=1871050 RepID=UPI002E0EF29F|nr:hypothetical protein [Bosea sp. (in: a-proteobacteria)]